MKNIVRLLGAVVFGAILTHSAAAATTDGTATLTATLSDPAGNFNRRVDAFWITDAAGKFIVTVRKDAASEQAYLLQWNAARGTSTVVDGYSGATISTWTPMTVPWNCRDANNVLVADGTYKFYVEFTDHNGQGWWTTNGLSFVKGTVATTNTYPDQPYITGKTIVYTPAAVVHDVAVTGMTPNTAQANTNVTVGVAVTNKTANAESFSVILSNATTAAVVGSQAVSLAGNVVTNVGFAWNTAGLQGSYVLRASAGPVTGETSTADNSFSNTVAVQAVAHDIAVTSLSPTVAAPNSGVTLTVGVANRTANSESFSVVLSNATSAVVIGSKSVGSLAGNASTNVAFQWSTTNLAGSYNLRASAGPVAGEVAVADNSLAAVVNVRAVVHDVAIAAIQAPALVSPNSTATITITATNAGETAESFGLQLYDDTDARAVGPTSQVTSLAAGAVLNVPFAWNTTNSSLGYHTLRAVASPVIGETSLANNTNTVLVAVASNVGTNTFIARGGAWRYNDQGLDLTATPWRLPDYYDEVWSQGSAPLGYSADRGMTNLATRLDWGPVATAKIPTYYFRREFYADALPTTLALSLRCVDGAAVYLNGAEVARFNLPAGSIAYTDLAASPVTGASQYAFVTTNLAPTGVVLGRNVLAVEVHRADLAGPALVFDLELRGPAPQSTASHDIDAVALTTPGGVILGDQMPVSVTLTNRGNVTETALVLLKDITTGQVVGSQTVNNFVPGSAAVVQFNWGTLGAANGANRLVAYTVVAGITNFAGAYTNTALISGSGFSTNNVSVSGTIGGRCGAITATGNLLLTGAGATLEVWNRSNVSAPVRQGAVRLPGLIQSIAASGSYAYVACGSGGVAFVDLSSPAAPVHRRTFNSTGQANAVAISGTYLYVADGVAGLRIINIATPSNPSLVGAYYTPGPARAVAVASTRAYVLDQEQGLLILNVSSPSAPTLLGTYANFDAGQALAVSGSYAYLVDGNNHFAVLNVANPAAPTLAGSLVLANVMGQDVTVNGTTVYVAAGANGLLTINAASPAAPVLVSTTAMPGEASEIALANSRLYVADGFSGFQIFIVAAPAAPALQADYPSGLRAADVVLTNNLAYVAAGESGLRIFTLSNTAAPVLLGRFAGVANARAVAVAAGRAYVGDGYNGLKVVAVTNPANPTLLGSYSNANLGSIRNVGVSGSLAIVSDGRGVQLLDISSPSRPYLLGTYTTPAFAFDLTVNGSRAYLACGRAGLVILNLSRSSFTRLGSYVPSSLVSDVSISGNTAYLAGPATGWWAVSVTNPASPRLLRTSTSQGPVVGLAAAGTNLTLLAATNFAVNLRVSSTLNAVPSRAFGPLVRAIRLAALPTLAVAAEDEAGLALFATAAGSSGSRDSDDDDHTAITAAAAVADGTGSEGLVAPSPLPSNSVLPAMQSSADRSTITLHWYSVPGQTYTIYRSTDLNVGFTPLQSNIAATPPLNTFTDSMTSPAAFYIIAIE